MLPSLSLTMFMLFFTVVEVARVRNSRNMVAWLLLYIFPSQLKIVKVIPILKKYDNNIFNNYRQISHLPVLPKVIEKVICSQINNFFITNNLFYDSQYGFRPGHSTEYAAIEITDRIITAMDTNNIPLNIYLGLSNAFDTLDHAILLDTLFHYGIRGNPLKLISSYLENRQQFVEFRNTKIKYTANIYWRTTGVNFGTTPIFNRYK